MQSIEQALAQGVGHHQSGRLAEAEKIYRQVLARDPNQADALHLLGLLAHQSGHSAAGMELVRRAIAQQPATGNFHATLGTMFQDLGRAAEAVESLRRAVQLDPADAVAFSNLGDALRAAGRLEEAIEACRTAIRLQPDSMPAHAHLGNALKSAKRGAEALAAYREALRLGPNEPGCHSNLASLLNELGRFDDAVAECQAALRLNPRFAEAYGNLGNALKDSGRVDEAIAAYRAAMQADPKLSAATQTNLLYTMHFHPGLDAAAIDREHRSWDQRYAQPLVGIARPPAEERGRGWGRGRGRDDRLRIGYVSPDFREHPVGRAMLPLIEFRDREKFEVICYSDVLLGDEMTARLRDGADEWIEIAGRSDAALAERVRSDRIDILVDTTLHMARNRLLAFARKPAPVQATFLGYPATTGLSAMDYRITDAHLDPPGETEAFNSEQLVRLPHSFWCYRGEEDVAAGPLPAEQAGHITFGSLNAVCKLNGPTIELWAKVLDATPGSRMLVLAPVQSGHLMEMFARHGIGAERLETVTKRPRREYLLAYQRIDIGLDPMPYNGHMTSCDSFWMGVAVISLRGRTSVGRGGVSLLSNLGMTELLAETPEEFVRIAGELGRDRERLASMRAGLRERMRASPLCDERGFARDVEAAYRMMWQSQKIFF